ncbi:MAG: DUF5060 domain-containing protein [Bacteroidota bacterium]
MKNTCLLICLCLLGTAGLANNVIPKWQPFILDLEGPSTKETDSENPFLDYRLNVIFSKGKRSFVVPGFFAADGNAANSGAGSGKVWRTIFTPDEEGEWQYEVSFRKGKQLAVSDDPYLGQPVEGLDGQKGRFRCGPPSTDAQDIRSKGRLTYHKSQYFHFQNGEPYLKVGANSPENFLAFADIDGTYSYDPNAQFLKSWEAHIADWNSGDPTWQNGKGKGAIGALNYLASKSMNVVYALTLNIEGDAKDVWPFLSHERKDFLRYDVSKLAQWDILFTHAESKGIVLHLITQEKENELILDDGYTDVSRKLYYRELIARFGYHNNVIWNMGEENGQVEFWPQGQSDQQRYAMIRYLKDHDPYKNPLVIHTFPAKKERDEVLEALLHFDRLDGISMQVADIYKVHRDIRELVAHSGKSRRPWVVTMDEIGPWHTGTRSDKNDPRHDTLRQEVLWGTLMAGGGGVEWYFGWIQAPNDLNAEDWRSRNNMWEQSAIAANFFKAYLPFTEMKSSDELVEEASYCLSKENDTYVVYCKKGGKASIDLSKAKGKYRVHWFDPLEGGVLQQTSTQEVSAGAKCSLGMPPSKPAQDWAILLRKLP